MTVRHVVVDHVLFVVSDLEASLRFYRAAQSSGGRDHGSPGVWVQYSDRYYAAFAFDPEGNNVEAVFHSPEPLTDDAPVRRFD
jgi:catechol 2,3-dioxygenase-like lactoylglutathione lyase family enzyme